MRDLEPWGERRPYGPGEPWPVRVDRHLAEGVREEDVERWVPTASILHSNGDGLEVAVAGGRIVGVRGRADDRVNTAGSTSRTATGGRRTGHRIG